MRSDPIPLEDLLIEGPLIDSRHSIKLKAGRFAFSARRSHYPIDPPAVGVIELRLNSRRARFFQTSKAHLRNDRWGGVALGIPAIVVACLVPIISIFYMVSADRCDASRQDPWNCDFQTLWEFPIVRVMFAILGAAACWAFAVAAIWMFDRGARGLAVKLPAELKEQLKEWRAEWIELRTPQKPSAKFSAAAIVGGATAGLIGSAVSGPAISSLLQDTVEHGIREGVDEDAPPLSKIDDLNKRVLAEISRYCSASAESSVREGRPIFA